MIAEHEAAKPRPYTSGEDARILSDASLNDLAVELGRSAKALSTRRSSLRRLGRTAEGDAVIPTVRLRPIVEEYLARGGSRDITGVNPRSFYKVLNEATKVSFAFADRLLLAIGRQEEWHLSLADLYAVDGLDVEEEPAGSWRCSCGWEVPAGRPDARAGDVCALCYAAAHRGHRFGPWTRDELLTLYRVYVRHGYTILELVAPAWTQKGYKSRQTAASAVIQAWRRNTWPMRARHESRALARKRRGPRLLATRSLNADEARRLHPLHWEQWQSINSIAKEHAARLGMTQSALCSQLSYTWKLLGLPRHDRIEMTVRVSTKHGMARRARPKNGGKFGNGSKAPGYKRWLANDRAGGETRNPFCVGTTAMGKPCRHRAMDDSEVCQAHDPERRAAMAARLADMRTRSPKHDPANLVQLGPSGLQADLAAYFAWAKGWKQLAEMSGFSNTQLRRWLIAAPETNVMRSTERRLRRALLAVTPVCELGEILEEAA